MTAVITPFCLPPEPRRPGKLPLDLQETVELAQEFAAAHRAGLDLADANWPLLLGGLFCHAALIQTITLWLLKRFGVE